MDVYLYILVYPYCIMAFVHTYPHVPAYISIAPHIQYKPYS
jgi:hypothetical protein